MPVGIGIVGAGRMGCLHAFNLSKFGTIVAVADAKPKLAQELANQYGAEPYDNYMSLVRNRNVDAVCICTPVVMHKEIVLEALDAKKHILCEKPLTLTVDDANIICEAIDKSGIVFVMGFMRRFDEDFMQSKKEIMRGKIGNIVYIRSSGRDPGLPPVPGWGSDPDKCGDISFELCSHDYDSIQWLLSSDIKRVYAKAGILSSAVLARKYKKMINDTLVVVVEFDNGALGSIDGLLNIKYGYDARVEVVGEKGMIGIGSLQRHGFFMAGTDKLVSMKTPVSFFDRFAKAYTAEAKHFVNCIINGDRSLAGAVDGLKAVRVASAVNESIKTGRQVSVNS